MESGKIESFAKTQISKNALNKIKHLQGENRPKTTSCEGLKIVDSAIGSRTTNGLFTNVKARGSKEGLRRFAI